MRKQAQELEQFAQRQCRKLWKQDLNQSGSRTLSYSTVLPLNRKFSSASASLVPMCCAVLSRSFRSDSLRLHGLQPARLLCPWDSLGKNTGVGCHALLQGIFQTQGLNPCLLHGRWILYPLSRQRNPFLYATRVENTILILNRLHFQQQTKCRYSW